jgi:hypothetical protein
MNTDDLMLAIERESNAARTRATMAALDIVGPRDRLTRRLCTALFAVLPSKDFDAWLAWLEKEAGK